MLHGSSLSLGSAALTRALSIGRSGACMWPVRLLARRVARLAWNCLCRHQWVGCCLVVIVVVVRAGGDSVSTVVTDVSILCWANSRQLEFRDRATYNVGYGGWW